jgi:lambda family phage tail tape measure protein
MVASQAGVEKYFDLRNFPQKDRDKAISTVDKKVKKQGYDGILEKDKYGIGQVAVYNPNQIKLADPITKTDRGVPVPLSARFDDSVADIRGNVNDIFAGLKSQAGEALQPLIAELETQFAAMGDNSINSLINSLEGLMGQLRGTGGDVGDSLKDGVDGSLDMHSPSEEMRNRGENAGDSFGMGAVESLRAAGNAISAEINKLKATIDKDLEYLRAVATGDTAKAQAMVGDAAKGAGYNVGPVYHGTKAEFTEFDTNLAGRNMGGNTFGPKGIWFTKNKEKASSWAKQGRVIDAYVKPGSIIDDAGALRFGRDRFADPGVDSIVTNNVVVAKRSNQIKSADAVTKTNDGKPVPLSARFDDSVADIRGNVNDIFAGLKSQAGEALQPLIAELETQFAAMGDNSINSLINSLEGLMGQLRGTGGDVGDELAEGTETALDMDSPSKVYKAIGQNIIAGLEGGLEGFDGTLEEKRKLLDTYVKSVIELVYDLPKVTGEATTQAQKVRKLFQDIGQAGTATTQQLNQAQGYFPELGLLAKDSPAAATYLVRKNKILVNPDRQEQLPDDLMHEYSHALQGRFGLGTRWANKAQDYLREKGVLGRRAEADDPMVKTAAGRSAKSFMDQMGVNPESRQYQAGFDHIYGAETEAYANELGIGKERKRRGFFKADAEEIAAQIKAAKAEAKKAALELKEAGKEVTEAIGHGFEEGKQFSQDVLANVMNWLENIPILGLLVKLARGIGSAIGGLFSGQKATPQVAKQKPPKQAIAEAMQSVEMPEVVKPTESLIKPIQQTAEQIRQKAAEISASVDQSIEEKLAELETIAELTETAIATEIDTKQIADQWLAGIKDWLKQLGKGFEAGLGGEIAQLKADGKNVAEELKEKAADMEWGLDEKQAQFRQAIADGNAELSKAIGTELLEQSEQLRILFKEVAKNIKFFEGRGLWRDEAARMQALQKEVIQGRRGKDFAKTGIYQAIASGQIDPAANQQALKTEIPYEYVPVSFGMEPPEVEPVTVELEPGELQLPELEPMAAEVEAAKIEIPDPDTLVVPVVAEVDEDGGGFTGFLDTIKEALDQSDTVIGDFIAGLSDSITNGMDALEGLYGEVKQVFPGVEGVKDLFVGLGIAAGGAMVVQGLVGAIGMLGGVSLDALVGLESMERAFLALTGSSESAKRSMKFARDEANRLGVDLLAIEEAYMGLSAATRGTALEGSATDAILSSFAETASLRGLDTEQQGSMFTALQQVIGKRKLSAEEVRQQLGEIPGLDFQGTLARGMGISVGQLDDLMSSGQLLAEDVLPQVAAQYAAENAVVANSSETTGQAIARFNNSLIEFQRSLQSSFGFAKQIFNGMASLITWFGGAMPGIIGLLTRLGLVMAWGPASVLVSMLQTQVAGQSFAAVMQTIGTTLARILPTIGKFLAQMILMELAFDAIGAVVDVVKSPFEEWDKSLQKATKSVEALEKAYSKLATIKPVDELGGGWTNRVTRQLLQGETKNNLPVNPEDVLTSDTWNLFGLDTGMNLEFARKGFKGLGIGGKTLGQRQQEMAGERVGNTVSASQRTLALEEEARADLESIKELDRQLARVQLKRMDNVAGDREAYNAMIAEEKALQERRKAILDKTATFQQSVQDNIENVKKSLSELETQKDQTEISAGEYESRKSRLDLELEALEASRDEFEKSASSIQVASNALALALQKLNENYAAFNENMERQASRTRTQFLRQAQASGTGSTVRSMGLSALESDDLTLRVSFLREQLGEINNNLSDPDFARQLEELKIESEAMGVDINNSATLDRIIGDAGNKYKNVAETLKRSLELETELAQTEEQLAQSSVDMEQSLFDLSNVIEDFFQQLTQQFEEARIELDRVKNQLRYGGLKQKLQKALVPGSNSFINGVIGSIQGIFDQASSVMESVLGQRSARLSFAGEKYSLDNQMTDFARSVNGATQAVEAFRASLAGGQATLNNAGQSGAVATNRGGGVGNVSGTLGYIGSTGRSTGPHLDLRGFTGGDRQSRMTEARLKQIARDFEVGGKPLSSAPITSGYGMRVHPVTGQRAMHPGLDYGIPMGTPITYKGQAVKINQRANFGGAGNTIEIVLPTGEIVQLLHLQKFGQAVIQSAQTAIASNATGPTKTAKASFYGGPSDPTRWHGRKTASGEVYDENGLTVAVPYRSKSDKRPSIPFGTYLLVTNPANGKQVVVRVTDTGNFGTDAQYGGRGLDLSYGAAKQLGTVQSGVANVNYQVVDKNQRPAPVATNVSYSQPQQQAIVATTPDPAIARGQKLTADIVNLKGQIVDGNGQINQQKVQEVILSLQQYTQELNRGIDDNLRGLGNINADARDTFAGLMQQFSPQTLESQSEADRRQTATTLRQTSNELFERSRAQEDEIKGAKKTVAASKAIIAEITANPSAIPEEAQVEAEAIKVLENTISKIEGEIIPQYEKALALTKEQEKQLGAVSAQAEKWLEVQRQQRQLDQDGEMIALRASVAQASFNEQLKLKADLETVDNEFEKRKLQEQQRLIDQPELLKDVLAQLEKERDAKKKNLQYDFDALIRGRELEAVGRQLGLAQSEFNSEKILSLEIAQAELEAENNRLKILREVTDETEKARQLELTDAEKLQKIRRAELDNINRILDRKQGDRDLDSRQAENAANLSRNPFAATQLRENNAIANRQLEFERRAEEIRQTQPADRAAAMIAQESEILAQDLELIDREFRDLSETIGDNLGNAFNSFTDALISGDNALQAFTNALLKSVSDIGSQLMQQGMQGLMQNIFGKSGAIGGLFGGGGNPVASVGSILPGMITPFMGPKLFADGGYTGDGGKYEAKGIVHGGEFVINKAATRKIGLPALMTANTLGQLPGYATGGYVGSVESRLLSGLNSTRMPSTLPSENRRSPVTAGPVSNTVNVNINDRESRFFKQSRTLAREIADELRV